MTDTPLDYIRVSANEEKHLLYTIWLRDATSAELRTGVLSFLKLVETLDVWYWIVDARPLRCPSITDQHWILKEVAPALVATKLRKIARLGSNDVFSYMAYENIAEKTRLQFNATTAFAQFTAYDAALDWINLME